MGILLIRTMGVSPILCRILGRMAGELALKGVRPKLITCPETHVLHLCSLFHKSPYKSGNLGITLELESVGNQLLRLPGSICSGWEGQAGSIFSLQRHSLCSAEWLCPHALHRSSGSPYPPRWCGAACWREGTLGHLLDSLWPWELMAWLTLEKRMQLL